MLLNIVSICTLFTPAKRICNTFIVTSVNWLGQALLTKELPPSPSPPLHHHHHHHHHVITACYELLASPPTTLLTKCDYFNLLLASKRVDSDHIWSPACESGLESDFTPSV